MKIPRSMLEPGPHGSRWELEANHLRMTASASVKLLSAGAGAQAPLGGRDRVKTALFGVYLDP
jgi:hypothetical protein